MKWLKLIGGISYLTSFIVLLNSYIDFGFYLDNNQSIILFVTLGGIGFLLNLISYKKDKIGTHKTNLLFWIGGISIFFGLTLKIFHFNFSNPLIILGFLAITISMIYYSRKSKNKKNNSDILDQR